MRGFCCCCEICHFVKFQYNYIVVRRVAIIAEEKQRDELFYIAVVMLVTAAANYARIFCVCK